VKRKKTYSFYILALIKPSLVTARAA